MYIDTKKVNAVNLFGASQRAMSAPVSAGVYRHYKNNYYLIYGVSTHTESGEQCVVYQSLYGDFGIWSRPLDMFISDIEYNGVVQPRFKKVAESYEAEKYIHKATYQEQDRCRQP